MILDNIVMTKTRAQSQAAGTSEKTVLSPPQGKGKITKRRVKSVPSGASAGPSRREPSPSPSPPPPTPSQSPTPPSPGSERDRSSHSRCVVCVHLITK